MFETIVLATDGSSSAERAVTLALDFADRFDATLHALYVIDEDDTETDADTLREEGAAALSEIGERVSDLTTVVRRGDPAEKICDYAENVGADLVVTGTRGRHGEHAYLLGSVAEEVVRSSPAPVLTARQLDADTPEDVPVPGGVGE